MLYYYHKVRERATSKPTLRDVGNLHKPYKSPPFRQRLTALFYLEFVKLLTTTPPGVSLAPQGSAANEDFYNPSGRFAFAL